MSPRIAIHNPIFLTYLAIVAAILAVAGAALLLMRFALHKNVRSIWQTYLGWLIMIPLIGLAIFLGRWAVIAGAMLLSIFGFKEFARATGLHRDGWMSGAVYLLMIACAAIVWFEQFRLFLLLPLIAIAILTVIPILRNRTQGQLQSIALSVFGFLYIGWMFAHLSMLTSTVNPYGYLIFLILATELNDVAAFTSGKLFGHLPLRSNISPRKTWGGAIGAVGVSIALPFLLRFSLPNLSWVRSLAIGLLIGIGGQLGDLVISVIKRDIGIKDMGASIPGHGGILDRIDSLIFVAPWFLYVVQYPA